MQPRSLTEHIAELTIPTLLKILFPFNSVALMADLQSTYSHKSRSYHTMHHVQRMFNSVKKKMTDPLFLKKFPELIRSPLAYHYALLYAIVMHDYVYVIPTPTNPSNEYQSAVVATQWLDDYGYVAQFKIDFKNLVSCLILNTEHTKRDKNTTFKDLSIWEALIIDADLVDMADPILYHTNGSKIREEYGYYNDAEYNNGRKIFIGNFLSRKHILFVSEGDKDIRENLQKEWSRLF